MNRAARVDLIGREVDERLREVAHARIRDARHVSVAGRLDDVVRHQYFEAARIGRVVDPGKVRSGRLPRLIDAQHVVFRKSFGHRKERARGIQAVRARARRPEVDARVKIRDVAQQERGRNDDRVIIGRGDRRHGNNRTRQRLLHAGRFGRVRPRNRIRIRPADDDGVVDLFKTDHARGRDVGLALAPVPVRRVRSTGRPFG